MEIKTLPRYDSSFFVHRFTITLDFFCDLTIQNACTDRYSMTLRVVMPMEETQIKQHEKPKWEQTKLYFDLPKKSAPTKCWDLCGVGTIFNLEYRDKMVKYWLLFQVIWINVVEESRSVFRQLYLVRHNYWYFVAKNCKLSVPMKKKTEILNSDIFVSYMLKKSLVHHWNNLEFVIKNGCLK